ncbi:MAG: 2Fe-2S iron-sulfur cluster-binding protein [Pseudomonadota bacterium]
MPQVKYIEADGTTHVVDAEIGISVMEAALDNGVPGIDGDCGGQLACGTCHIYVDQNWIGATGKAGGEAETDMLEFVEDVRENSRLACQVILTEKLNELTVHLPEGQH